MKSITKLMLACAAAAMLTAPVAPLAAQDTPPAVSVNGDIKAEKAVTGADGKPAVQLVDPESFLPGDRLVFGQNFANTSAEIVTNFTITNPLPEAVRLAPDADPGLEVSVDRGKSWGRLSALSVTAADGTSRPALHADVTHVRWVLATIAPGASGRVAFPVIIR
ncbi:MAG: hypothetical protein NBV68_06780 [Erythrobacter sp.]|uniref:hypothetical protein n=1 Tax=Erythrobacter sp. TaxID=1042 RepID=UPI0025CF3EAD|nr:hypothetical protein [Erythrobacter sp.]MCL9999069.1 hypothetical protein [Erythrobacter sp.]